MGFKDAMKGVNMLEGLIHRMGYAMLEGFRAGSEPPDAEPSKSNVEPPSALQ